jgi:hypothetical protein
VSFAKFLFLPSWFAKLLEANFSYFAKIIWMPSWFAKLLELLNLLSLVLIHMKSSARKTRLHDPYAQLKGLDFSGKVLVKISQSTISEWPRSSAICSYQG